MLGDAFFCATLQTILKLLDLKVQQIVWLMFTFVLDFANSTLQNSFLVIFGQQKNRFILIFAANPRTYLKLLSNVKFL